MILLKTQSLKEDWRVENLEDFQNTQFLKASMTKQFNFCLICSLGWHDKTSEDYANQEKGTKRKTLKQSSLNC